MALKADMIKPRDTARERVHADTFGSYLAHSAVVEASACHLLCSLQLARLGAARVRTVLCRPPGPGRAGLDARAVDRGKHLDTVGRPA
jgi:hypothetical protein